MGDKYFKAISINKILFILCFTFCITLISNLNTVHLRFVQGASIFRMIYEFYFVWLLCFIFLLCFYWNNILLKFATVTYFLISVFSIYLYYVFGLTIEYRLLINIVNTENSEIWSFLTPSAILLLLLTITIISYFCLKVKFTHNFELRKKRNIAYIISAIIIIILLHLFMHKFNTIKFAYSPFTFIQSSFKVLQNRSVSRLESIVKANDITNLNKQPTDIVLIIGESANVYHQQYHGYKRNTNEFTKKLKNIVYFNKVTSCWTATAYSVPCMLSSLSQREFLKNYPPAKHNVAEVFAKAGFVTYWISKVGLFRDNLRDRILSDFKYSQYAEKALISTPLTEHDDIHYDIGTLKVYNKEFDPVNNKNKYNFIVFHSKGSHARYIQRYPKSFDYYKKPNNNSEDQMDNEYDNSLRYSDYVYAKIVNLFKNRRALILFFSDHGDSLKSDHSGVIYHGTPYDKAPKEQTHISAWAWASDKWLKDPNNARKYKLIKEKSNKSISHDWVFHSLIDCADIKISSNLVNKKLSLCSK